MGTAAHTLAVATELTIPTVNLSTWVQLTDVKPAPLEGAAARKVTIVRATLTADADLAPRTVHVGTWIHTIAIHADLLVGAAGDIAGLHTLALSAHQITWALTLDALFTARAKATNRPAFAARVLVDQPVAIIVDTIAAIPIDHLTSPAVVAQAFVNQAVAVHVTPITELVTRLGCLATKRGACRTGQLSQTTLAKFAGGTHPALALGAFVRLTVAVVVESVADFVRRH